jgi:hypothetical protein
MTIEIQKSRQPELELELPALALEVNYFVSSRFSSFITRDNGCDTQGRVNISAIAHQVIGERLVFLLPTQRRRRESNGAD